MPPDRAIIIIGSGLAGLSATSQILSHNPHIPVLMLERALKPGGNSIKASSGINGAPTRFQPSLTSEGDISFMTDTVKSAGSVFSASTDGERDRRERLIDTLVTKSTEAVEWLVDDHGVDLSHVALMGGHSYPRTHRGAGKTTPGYAIVSSLLKSVGEQEMFRLETEAQVTRVFQEGGEVAGVEYKKAVEGNETETIEVYGPVVFANGGFAGDAHGMLAKYRPDLAGIPSTNEAREGGQPILQEVGAAVVDMEQVQVHPTGFVDMKEQDAMVKILAAEVLRGEGGVLVLGDGKRFVNELETREHVTNAVMEKAGRLEESKEGVRQWDVRVLLDEGTAAALDAHLGFYTWKGLIRKTTVGDLSCDMPELTRTLQEHADVVAGEKQDPFGRTSLGNWTLKNITPESVIYIGQVTPVVHFTMGGVVINEHSQVLDNKGEAIKGMWAAGEITGGLHGQNRLGGSSLLECVVFGRIAGDGAAAFYNINHG